MHNGREGRDGSSCSPSPLEGEWKHLGLLLQHSCAVFMIPWGEFPGQRDCQPQAGRVGKLPLPWGGGAGGWGGKDDRWMKDRVAHMKPSASGGVSHVLCSILPRSGGEGFCLASGQNQPPLSSPGRPQTWMPLAAPFQGCLFYCNQAESRIPVITTTSDGRSAISHPPAAGWS